MLKRRLFAALILTGTSLLASQAQAWWVAAPRNIPAAHSRYLPVDTRPVIIHGVNFPQDSDMLTHESTLILDAVAKALKARPMQRLQVSGHTSADGTAKYNLDLSSRRAKAVRDWLIFRGVPAESLSYRGYGESYPLANNMTAAGRSLNRRVELAPVLPTAF
jgi:outer membrane protein OmpA-like peptidoglycan-associated protein